DRTPLADPGEARRVFTQIAQDVATLLERRTADGYVLRVDYRLRPDPGSTPPAISRAAAEVYYAAHGQNWERAAFIKARPVAGDVALGAAILNDLRPFIWRRTLDFAALRDVLSLKRQRAALSDARADAAGGDVKFGRGGIRDIEFFAQTQQLIWGGRDPDLRARRTEEALRALEAADRIDGVDIDGLIARYWRLRAIEQRLQMRDDRQTYRLPEDGLEFERFATFAGFAEGAALSARLGADMRWAAQEVDRLFPEAPSLASACGPLAFAGEEIDPNTTATLSRLGFGAPETLIHAVRGWHRGKPRATRSERARQSLTELTPALLDALAATADPDGAFQRFDAFLTAQSAGAQLLDLLQRHPDLLAFLAKVMGDAPQVANFLAQRPALLDALLDPGFDGPPPCGPACAAALDAALSDAQGYEMRLDAARRWAAERAFHAAVRLLSGATDADAASAGLSDVADAVIDRMMRESEAAFAERHGRPPCASAAVLALGKLGARSLAFGSDLDLIYLYCAPMGRDVESDGDRPLAPGVWFNRAAQRLIAALSAKTAEGAAYEVDFRLRPYGDQGPTATALDGFQRYHETEAWTWEAMALTRARVVAGPPDLRAKVDAALHAILTRRRDPDALRRDVAAMRARVAAAKPTLSPWSFKHLRGGLMDVEFVLQHAQLRAAADHPEVLQTNADSAAAALARAGVLPERDAETLADAARLWRRAQAILRLSLGTGEPPAESADLGGAPAGLRRLLARALDAPDFPAARAKAEATAAAVVAIFDREIGPIDDGQDAVSATEAPARLAKFGSAV
ncbi:MAG: bifunctional [glutamine synthetase] adenylyltransferase/[glutamine synthetase]-adenylyl-L-tyrosine phosphorylase, partial [Pseudomonadota bacterium]